MFTKGNVYLYTYTIYCNVDLRAKYDHQKRQYSETLSQLKSVSAKYKDFQSSNPPLSPPCVNDVGLQAELKEQNALLTTQLQAYKVSVSIAIYMYTYRIIV